MSTGEPPEPTPVLHPDAIVRASQRSSRSVYMDDKIKNYIVDLVMATRDPDAYKVPLKQYLQYGASPRASIYLAKAPVRTRSSAVGGT